MIGRLTAPAQAAGNPRHLIFLDVALPLAVAIALCGWATVLSLLSLDMRYRLLIIGGVSALASGLAFVAVALLVPPAYQNAVAIPIAIVLGVGSLLLIGVLISYLGMLIWDTASHGWVTVPLMARMFFRTDLPPGTSDMASDHELAVQQMESMDPTWARTVEEGLREMYPSYSGKIRNPPRKPDGPWWQRVLAVAAKGYISTAAMLLFIRGDAFVFGAPILVGTQAPQALEPIVLVVAAVLLFPVFLTAIAAFGAPIVLLIRDWRPGSPLRFWSVRAVVGMLYAVGVALEVFGGLFLLFGWRPA